jgi:pimeloyl-ACP methyl ester carboxylesterase
VAGLRRGAAAGVVAPRRSDAGQPVLVVPGFLAGDWSLRPVHDFLRAAGHDPHPSGIRRNVGCSEACVAHLCSQAERLADAAGGPIAVLGHSRGGLFARVLAHRRPDLIASVITLGSPHRDQLAIHPLIWVSAAALATCGSLRVPGLLRWSCGTAGCCSRFLADLASPLPAGIGALAVYSRRDGVVDWRACVDPAARQLEVAASHCGMVTYAPALWAVAAAIAEFAPID